MADSTAPGARTRPQPGRKMRGAEKLARIPVKVEQPAERLRKPAWLKVRLPTASQSEKVKRLLRDARLTTVCEEASCPNLPETCKQMSLRPLPFRDARLPVKYHTPNHLTISTLSGLAC